MHLGQLTFCDLVAVLEVTICFGYLNKEKLLKIRRLILTPQVAQRLLAFKKTTIVSQEPAVTVEYVYGLGCYSHSDFSKQRGSAATSNHMLRATYGGDFFLTPCGCVNSLIVVQLVKLFKFLGQVQNEYRLISG